MLLRELHSPIRVPITEAMDIGHVLAAIDKYEQRGMSHHSAVFKVLDSLGINTPDDRIAMQGQIKKEFKKRADQKRKEAIKNIPRSYVI
jgi:hypothetical protein